MLADKGYLPKPGPAGKTWGCQFGDGSDAALGAPFTCNNKLIGAYAFTRHQPAGERRRAR